MKMMFYRMNMSLILTFALMYATTPQQTVSDLSPKM